MTEIRTIHLSEEAILFVMVLLEEHQIKLQKAIARHVRVNGSNPKRTSLKAKRWRIKNELAFASDIVTQLSKKT